MTITVFSREYRNDLANLLTAYFPQVDAQIPEDILQGKLMDLICDQQEQGILHIRLVRCDDAWAGFSIFQIDSPESDWCKRPGWGFVREFYIAPDFRRRGLGKALAEHTEQALRCLGAKQLYLTSDGGIAFWQRCGWQLTPETASNDLFILEK